MLRWQEGTSKHQHYHIQTCFTQSLSHSHTISTSSFPSLLHSFLFSTHCTLCISLSCFLPKQQRHTPKQIFSSAEPDAPKQQTPCMKTLWTAGDSCVLLCYSATTRAISHWFPILSLPSHLSGSQRCSLLKQIWFPTFVHLSFLRGLSTIALISFTWEKSDLHNQPRRREKSFLSTTSSKFPLGWHGNAVSHLHRLTTMCLQT